MKSLTVFRLGLSSILGTNGSINMGLLSDKQRFSCVMNYIARLEVLQA